LVKSSPLYPIYPLKKAVEKKPMSKRRGMRGSGSGHKYHHGRRQETGDTSASDGSNSQIPPDLAAAIAETKSSLATWLAPKDASFRHSFQGSNPALSLDPWQKEVFDALMRGSSVVVDAPTSAGKTRAVETYFATHITSPGFRACYTTPVKSLANDKLREFRERFGAENVGIATGDLKDNLKAPIVVATLESYRNSLLGVEPDLTRTLAVFDEYHYLQDTSRGSAWEEALILTPAHCQLLLLSASVDNAEEFVAWLKKAAPTVDDPKERDVVLVRTTHRPVPLEPLVWYRGHWLTTATARGMAQSSSRSMPPVSTGRPPKQEDLLPGLRSLMDLGLTPAILYCGRRISTETLARLIGREFPPLPEAQSMAIGEALERCHMQFKALSFIPPDIRQLLQVKGVGFHHSGLAAPARMAIESLVKEGLLRFCTATMGLSLGINFAVRATMITDTQRPSEQGLIPYDTSEILQMLGRAGRRGKDAVGFSLWPSMDAFDKMGGARRTPVHSRLRMDPTTFLGLVGKGLDLRGIEAIYTQSFRRFQDLSSDFSLFSHGDIAKILDQSTGRSTDELPAAALQVHLHRIGALEPSGQLSTFGSIARYFPQNGGLLIAQRLAQGDYGAEDLLRLAELCGIFSLARFKEPRVADSYRPPLDITATLAELERLYPLSLFPEVYDLSSQKRGGSPTIREFNPAGGYIIRQWLSGTPWRDLVAGVTTEQFGAGDVMALIYRVATYFQSIAQADIKDLAEKALNMRTNLLQDPLSLATD
jgi:hypothetical protein